jgi:hypothetical protein
MNLMRVTERWDFGPAYEMDPKRRFAGRGCDNYRAETDGTDWFVKADFPRFGAVKRNLIFRSR